jgi:hypothetical protein
MPHSCREAVSTVPSTTAAMVRMSAGVRQSSAWYCPDDPVNRGEMAYVVVVAREDPVPPPACIPGMERFIDAPASDPLCPWIEELSRALEHEGPAQWR